MRDADILHLYKLAGWQRFLLGMESMDEATLALIQKGATTADDREANRLLRLHGTLSMATWVIGFEEESSCCTSPRTAGRHISASRQGE